MYIVKRTQPQLFANEKNDHQTLRLREEGWESAGEGYVGEGCKMSAAACRVPAVGSNR